MRPILTSWLYRIGKERKQSTSVTLMGFKIEIDKTLQISIGNDRILKGKTGLSL